MASLRAPALLTPPETEQSATVARRGHPVARFVLRRVAAGLATLLVVSVLIFLATNALPGNVAQAVLGKSATPATTKYLETELRLNEPLATRYFHWLGGVVRGDLGQSATEIAQGAQNAPVSALIGTPLRNSLVLAVGTMVLLIPLSLLLGTIAAVRAGRATDYAVSYGSLVLGSLPEFVLGTLLTLIFFAQLNLLPPVALVPPGTSPLENSEALILPIATLLGAALAFSARQVRAGVIQALRQDYVMMARLSGIPERRVLARYALRNSLATTIQTFALSLQYLFGGIIVVEALYAYPGIGQLLVHGVSDRDVTLVQGVTLVLAALYIAINIVADLVVVLIVPRLRTGLQ
jgi:peptide/nickel transport system permease protein